MIDSADRPLFPVLWGPEASYELLGCISAIRNSSIRNGRSLILSAGSGAFAVQIAEYLSNVTVVHPDEDVVRRAKAKPLSSVGAIYRYFAETKDRPLHLMQFPVCSAQYRHAPLGKTGLKSGAYDFILIEQPHQADRSGLIDEVRRLAVKGGVIIEISYFSGQLIPRAKPSNDRDVCTDINEAMAWFFKSVMAPLLTRGERELLLSWDRYNELNNWTPDFQRRANMRATWNLIEFAEHINRWPVIQRIQKTPSALHLITLQNFIAAVHKRWGSSKVRRVINWPVLLKVGTVRDGENLSWRTPKSQDGAVQTLKC